MFKTKKDLQEKEAMKEEKKEVEEASALKGTAEEEGTGSEQESKEQETETLTTDELQRQVDSLKDRLLRKAAEFENYKKRTESEVGSFIRYANENLISELLPVIDDFERAIGSWDEKHDIETFREAVELIYDKFLNVLKKQGLKEIESLGKEFDVDLHDALMQSPDENLEPNTVKEVVEKGYYLKDKVLRHSKVIVTAKPGE